MNKAPDSTKIAISSEKEEVPDESARVPIVAFSDGVGYRRFSVARRSTEPTYRRAIGVISPLLKSCDNILSSAWLAFGCAFFPIIRSGLDGGK